MIVGFNAKNVLDFGFFTKAAYYDVMGSVYQSQVFMPWMYSLFLDDVLHSYIQFFNVCS